ncbi:TPA: hypothetical protein MHW87_21480 [Klebsiella pneumoniae]|uniref:hypothetical protein n=1 Tax=Klebsiella pneumoniae TaxID=573 RepID=UPI000E2D48E9|nr:hypothetical protein [Klebsiella pneumoniae]SWN56013.1 putative prophage endo-N-neuraminidase [Klebsiella pneumoniae]SWS31200.1 putative prophage endo-N-neuraminidase [Klebsiella pneumoniae]HBX3488164.1 hypothetical protein [Klebsiella pneumoniae]HBY5101732.1 hypothetical protein [Klebsiella pneumoniae]
MNISEKTQWENNISMLARQQKVEGGRDGAANIQAQQLANRTQYLRKSIEAYDTLIKTGEIPYSSIHEAQEAITAGRIPEGGLFSVRSEAAGIWVEEFKNINGEPITTGKRIADASVIAVTALATESDPEGTSTGLSITTPGQVFRVLRLDDKETGEAVYINNNGSAEKIKELASLSDVGRVIQAESDNAQEITVIQNKIQNISAHQFDSSANDLLIALTDALGRRTWLEADLRGRPSPYSVRLLREVLPDLLTGILFDSERYGLSAAITDSAGRRTWLEADMEGKPSARSAELIGGVIADYLPQSLIDALVDLLAPLISGEPRPVATALSTARQGAKREYPTLTKPLTAPVFSKSDQAAISIYWPWLFDATVIGVNKIYLYYSTDHAANHADSGIYLASADDITGPWTQHGRVYRDDVSGEQSETPSVVWDEKNNRMVMYYQQAGVGTGQQSTLWATSTDGFNWVRQGIATQMMSTGQPGDGHTGYFKPFRFAGSMYGYSLYGGTDRGRYAIWRGSDFGTWTPDPRLIGKMPDKCMNLPQYENGWFPKIFVGDVINWNGSPWWIGLVGPSTAGGGSNAHRICAAPLREDLRNLSANVVDITPAEQAWENGVIDYFGNFLTWKGKMYGVYRANTGQGGFGLVEVTL